MPNTTVQISISQLKIGMYVAALDRPWLGTPFLFQGFRVRTIDEIQFLKGYCESVHVDFEKSILVDRPRAARKRAAARRQPARIYEMSAVFEQEVRTANEIRATTRRYIDQLFDDVATDKVIDVPAVKRIVNDMMEGVLRNPDAHVCLTQLKSRDDYTAQHSINVCVLALAFARHVGLPPADMEALGVGALLHDIGKLRIPTEILSKPGKLTAEEFEIVKAHPTDGARLLEARYGLSIQVAETALCHHERAGGGGYPRGLKGEEIPLWGRLVAIVDVYDAITSDRSYHKGMSPTEALTKLYGWRLTDFDTDLIERFIQCLGIYPAGTVVELSSGEVGFVVSANPNARLRPTVNLLLDSRKTPLFTQRVINLADVPAGVDAESLTITRVLTPGEYGIDVWEHLAPAQASKAEYRAGLKHPQKAAG